MKDPFKINFRLPKIETGLGYDEPIPKIRTRKIPVPKKEYIVLTASSGVIRKHPFTSEQKARAFRELSRASSAYDSVSDVGEL